MEQTNETPAVPTTQPATEYAGFWLRFVAYLIDSLLIGFVIGILFGIFGVAFGLGIEAFGDIDDPAAQVAVVSLVGLASFGALVIVWLYYALLESGKNQATLGKMVLNIKVTDLEGNRISFARASGRFFCKFLSSAILYIGYIMIGFTEKQQGLHDMIAGCLVVRK